MVKAPQTKVLVVDRDLSVLSDYKLTLGGTPSEGKDDLLAEALRGDDSPPVTLISLQDPQEAPAVLREQIAGGSPVDIVFLEIGAPPAYEGLRAAERIRQLDPKVFLVIVSAYPDLHPTDLCKRVPPAERLFYLQKPLYPQEVLQLVYALGASRAAGGVGEERHGIDLWDLEAESLEPVIDQLPAAVAVYNASDRLVAANQVFRSSYPEAAPLLIAGTRRRRILDAIFDESDTGDAHGGPALEIALGSLGSDSAGSTNDDNADLRSYARRLEDGRCIMVSELRGAQGGCVVCLWDLTDLTRFHAREAAAAHLDRMSETFAALFEQTERGDDGAQESARSAEEAQASVIPIGGAAGKQTWAGFDGVAIEEKLRVVARRERLEPEPMDLGRMVGESVKALRGYLPSSSGLEIEVVAGVGVWEVELDPQMLRWVVAELIRNASDAMEGRGRVVIETGNVSVSREAAQNPGMPKRGDYVSLSVSDEGPGIPGVQIERVCDPFYTSKSERGRAGLGLSVVYGFARQSGGYMEIGPAKQGGASVRLFFPRRHGSDQGKKHEKDRVAVERARQQRPASAK